MTWLVDLPIQLQAAMIGAAVTLVGILIRDILVKLLEQRRERKHSALQVFRRYADPLVSAATNLLWRLNEIFYQRGRSAYLGSPITEFEHYKKISTLYRLASLLAWVRAFRRELSFLEVDNRRQLASLKAAIRSLESALADGPHIEIRRLKGLAELWNLPLPNDRSEQAALGVTLNNLIKPKLHTHGVKVANELPDEACDALCSECAEFLCRELRVSPLSVALLSETKVRAIERIAITEAWLYRDWQAAIGDLLIRKSEHDGRAFEVMGYGEFERLWSGHGNGESLWMKRLKNVVDGLDISADERFDARVEQLRKAMYATANLVIALAEAHPKRQVLLENTLTLARAIVQRSSGDLEAIA